MFANILKASSLGTSTNSRLSEDLEAHSNVLWQISKSFVERGKDLRIYSFYELDKMDFMNCRVGSIDFIENHTCILYTYAIVSNESCRLLTNTLQFSIYQTKSLFLWMEITQQSANFLSPQRNDTSLCGRILQTWYSLHLLELIPISLGGLLLIFHLNVGILNHVLLFYSLSQSTEQFLTQVTQ